MAEETVWSGTSSQWKNLPVFLLCLLVIPIPWAFWRWLQTRCQVYTLTTERLLISRGVLSKTTDTLELYRVKDFRATQPFLERLAGLENILLVSADTSTPEVRIEFIPQAVKLADLIRLHVEKCRDAKRVREIDVDTHPLT